MLRGDRSGDHARHRDRGGRQDDAVGDGSLELCPRRAVEHRDEQPDARAHMLDHEGVAQGSHVVMEQDGDAVHRPGERLAHERIGRVV